MRAEQPGHDIFVSYASEDAPAVSKLAHVLRDLGVSVWFDQFELTIGDSLRAKIDEGLRGCRYGAVVLSPAFFGKHHPERELAGLAQREVDGKKVLLPVWKDVTAEMVRKYSPPLADRVAADLRDGVPAVAMRLLEVVRPDIIEKLGEEAPLCEIPRIRKGSSLAHVFRSAHLSMLYNDDVTDGIEADLVGGFVEELRDLGDIWDDLTAPDHLKNELYLTGRIADLEDSGWSVYAVRDSRRLKLGGVEDVWTVADIAVVRGQPRGVFRSGDHIVVLRNDKQT